MDDIEEELHILLVGKRQAGKSTTGNILAGKECFRIHNGYMQETNRKFECRSVIDKRNHIKFVIIDCPEYDLMYECKRDIQHFYEDVFPGFHIVAIVQPLVGRYSEIEKQRLEKFKEEFGDCITNSVVIVFTKHDGNKLDHNTHLKTGPAHFINLIRDFGCRYCFVENWSDSRAKEEHARLTTTFAEMKQFQNVRLYIVQSIPGGKHAKQHVDAIPKVINPPRVEPITPRKITVPTDQFKSYAPVDSDILDRKFAYCSMCRRKNVLKYLCNGCGDKTCICEDCYSFHKVVDDLKHHRMQELESSFPVVISQSDFQVPEFCESNYHLTAGTRILFCETCNLYLCSKCQPCYKEHTLFEIKDSNKTVICNKKKHTKQRKAIFHCETCDGLFLCKHCKDKHMSETNHDIKVLTDEDKLTVCTVQEEENSLSRCQNKVHGTKMNTRHVCIECDKFLCSECLDKHQHSNHTCFKVSRHLKAVCSACSNEEKKSAKFICKTCNELFLCEECRASHEKPGGDATRHRIKPLKNIPRKEQEDDTLKRVCGLCNDDTNDPVTTYCFNCRMFICQKCLKEYTGTSIIIQRHLFLDIPTLQTYLARARYFEKLVKEINQADRKDRLLVATIRFSGYTIDCSVSFSTDVLCNNPPHGDVSRENTTRIFSHNGSFLINSKKKKVYFGDDAVKKYVEFDLKKKKDWFFCDDFEFYCFSLSSDRNESGLNKIKNIQKAVASVAKYSGRCLYNLLQSRGLVIPDNLIHWVVVLPPLDVNGQVTELRELVKQYMQDYSSVSFINELGLIIQLHWNSFFKKNRIVLRDEFITVNIRDNYAMRSRNTFAENGETINITEQNTEEVARSFLEILNDSAENRVSDRLPLEVTNYVNNEFRRNMKTLTKTDFFRRWESDEKYFKIYLEESMCSSLEFELNKECFLTKGITLNVLERTLEVDFKVAEGYIYGPISDFILKTVRKECPKKKVVFHCNLLENKILYDMVATKLRLEEFQDGVDFFILNSTRSLLAGSMDSVMFNSRLFIT